MKTDNKSIRTLFKNNNGYLRMKDFKSAGIPSRIIVSLQNDKIIDKIKPGLYRLTDLQEGRIPQSFIDVSVAVPKAIICLQSALEYHELTTLNPSEISVAVPNSYRPPKISYPPVEYYFFRQRFYSTGIEEVVQGSKYIRIYSKEKCICDAFHFRHRLGEDLALEALKNYLPQKGSAPSKLLEVAKACSMETVITPYLKAMVV